MRIYVAGPMRGFPLYNFPAFDAAAAELRKHGHTVISPAELDRELGFDEATDTATPAFVRLAIARDLKAIATCDAIYLLRGWSKSSGAAVELHLAKFLGLKVLYQNVPRIVGFAGRIGAGKDTAAEALVERGWVKVAFSDAVWEAVSRLDPMICSPWSFSDYIDYMGIEEAKRGYPEIRRLAQKMGTEVGRQLIGETVWLDALERRLDSLPDCPGVCVSGVRFDNEAQWIRQRGGLVIEVLRAERDGVDPSNGTHASETGLTQEFVDWNIRNDGPVHELHDRILEIVLGQAADNPRQAVAV